MNEQVALRRDEKKQQKLVPMETDYLKQVLSMTMPTTTEQEGSCWGLAEESEQVQQQEDVTSDEDDGMMKKLEAIMSFVKGKGGKGEKGDYGKGKGKKGKGAKECWHCGKMGHTLGECWLKDEEMNRWRAEKGKAKGSWGHGGGNGWKGNNKGNGGKDGGKGWDHGKGGGKWGKGGLHWFDQPAGGINGGSETAWMFGVDAVMGSSINDNQFKAVKNGIRTAMRTGPPGIRPPIITANRWDSIHETEEDNIIDTRPTVIHESLNNLEVKRKMPRATFKTVSQIKKEKKAKEKDDEAAMKESRDIYLEKHYQYENYIKEENINKELDNIIMKEVETNQGEEMMCRMCEQACVFIPVPKKEENVNMLGGWCKEDKGWTRVRSVMDSGAGVSVAPPDMCPTYPIMESEGSKCGQEFVSASQHTKPNLGEQMLNVVLDTQKEAQLKYQVADVSRALNSVSEICDAGHHVVFGRGGGIIVNLKTGSTTPFVRDQNVYCLDFWVKPFQGQGL